jgi:hypothetical protein
MGDRRVAAALAVVALLAVGYRLVNSRGGSATPPPQVVEPAPPAPIPPEPGLPSAAAPPVTPRASLAAGWAGPPWAWDRNPFLPATAERGPGKGGGETAGGDITGEGAAAEEKLPELRGTVVSRDAGLAIFGDRLVPVGEKVGEWTLTKVEPYKVSLRRGRETRVMELYRQ